MHHLGLKEPIEGINTMFVVWKEINEWCETKSRSELWLLLTRDAPYELHMLVWLIRMTRTRDNRMTLDGGPSYRRCLPREILHTIYSYSYCKDHSIPAQPGSTKDTSTNESYISLGFDISVLLTLRIQSCFSAQRCECTHAWNYLTYGPSFVPCY